MKKHLLLFFAALLPLLASASPVTSLAELNNGCLYHISQPYRNNTSWAVAQGETELMSNVTLGIENDVNDPCQQFAILSSDGGNSYYLYHVAEAKFVNNDGSLNDIPEDAIKFKNGAYDGTFVMYFDRAKHVNINSEKSLVIDNWSTADGGNSCEILPVGEYDLTEVLRIVPGIEKVEVDGIAYNLTKKDKLAVVTSRAVGYVGNITIPSMLRHENVEYTVRGIESDAFADCANLASINLPTSVTSIGNAAFYNCTNLKSIILPESVTSIGEYAFYGCTGLADIDIPEGVTNIEKSAFCRCSSLGSVTFLENSQLTSIGNAAFYNCTNLKSITLPESVTSIGEYAFYNCTNLINMNISEDSQLTSIGNYAFRSCRSLAAITIPESVTSIGEYAFFYCSNLSSVTFLENSQLTSIGDRAFDTCSSLTSVTIPEGVTSIGYGTFENCSSLTSVAIPESVTSIGMSAFENCSSLTSVTIPESVTSIGDWAFEYCTGLTFVTIPASVTSIERYAFSGCTGLGSVTFLENSQLTSIGERAFGDCSSLTSVTIPEGVTSIETSAFENCSSLAEITIPESVTSIGSSAFRGTAWCDDHPDGVVYAGKVLYVYKGNMPENTFIEVKEGTKGIAGSAFKNCTGLTSVTIPESVTCIGIYAFSGCSSLTAITIPEGVTSIEQDVFSDCSSLIAINIPEGVTSIGMSAFENCSSLAEITIPESVTNIGGEAFYGTAWYDNQPDGVLYLDKWLLGYKGTMLNNTSINVKEGTKGIADFAFSDCTGLTSVTIPESVTNIGYSAFYGTAWYDNQPDGVLYLDKWLLRYKGTMPNNTSINVKEGTKGIADYAFSGCSSLAAITLSKSVTSIGMFAFEYCSSLESITCEAMIPPTIGLSGTFYNVDKSIPVYVPAGSVEDYQAAEYWSDFTNILPLANEFTLTVSAAGYATLFLGYDVAIPDGVEVYIATSVEGDRLKMTQITDVLPAGTGVIVRAKAGTYTFTEIEGEYDAIEGNLLVGTTENTYITAAAGYNYYVLAQKDGVVGMYRPKLTNGQFLNNANKAYLALDMGNLGIFDDEVNTDDEGTQLSNRLRFDFGGTTGIEQTTDNSQQTTVIYDLQGRKVTDTKGLKGVYIVNGKKVVFK